MKKIFAALLTITALFVLTSCGVEEILPVATYATEKSVDITENTAFSAEEDTTSETVVPETEETTTTTVETTTATTVTTTSAITTTTEAATITEAIIAIEAATTTEAIVITEVTTVTETTTTTSAPIVTSPKPDFPGADYEAILDGTKTVCIAASGKGECYHLDENCSRMKGVVWMTLTEAESRDYRPCKKCFKGYF